MFIKRLLVVLKCSVNFEPYRFYLEIRYTVIVEKLTKKVVKFFVLIVYHAMVPAAVQVVVICKYRIISCSFLI